MDPRDGGVVKGEECGDDEERRRDRRCIGEDGDSDNVKSNSVVVVSFVLPPRMATRR
jgi:hypothetical protein